MSDEPQIGKLYRAKRPAKVWGEIDNDRVVIWINDDRTRGQYDSNTVAAGRHYPTVDMDKFLKWASHEVAQASADQ